MVDIGINKSYRNSESKFHINSPRRFDYFVDFNMLYSHKQKLRKLQFGMASLNELCAKEGVTVATIKGKIIKNFEHERNAIVVCHAGREMVDPNGLDCRA